MNRWTFAVLVILLGWFGRDGVRADEPATAPKQALMPFNRLEKLAVAGLFQQIEGARLSFCEEKQIPRDQCGDITPNGVYRLIPAKPEAK